MANAINLQLMFLDYISFSSLFDSSMDLPVGNNNDGTIDMGKVLYGYCRNMRISNPLPVCS